VSAKKRVTWVVLGPDPYLGHCERCGENIKQPPLPCPIPAFVKYCEYAAEAHRLCQPPAPAGVST